MKTKTLHLPFKIFAVAISFSLAVISATAQVCFSTTTNVAVGNDPHSVISADFNGDGKADIATANNTASNNVSILLGNGNGTFGSVTNFATGTQPISVISGKFNNDTIIDLAVVNNGSDDVSILLGIGNGTFSAAVNFAVGTQPTAIISADFNGDNKNDLAVTNSVSNNVSILLGNGLGGFASATNFTVGNEPVALNCKDFNNDTKLDLAIVNRTSNNVSILLGDGLGSFGSATNFTVGTHPVAIVSYDLNVDGNKDIAVVNNGTDNISVLLGTGTGGFGAVTNFIVGSFPLWLIGADFNFDGKTDLAANNSSLNNVSVLLGTGTGSFGTATNFAVGTIPVSIVSADLNNDGKSDLITSNQASGDISIRLNVLPNLSINATATTICAGAMMTLTAYGAAFYTWTGGVTNGLAFAAPSTLTTFTVTGTTNGCANTATQTISINPLPTATFTTHNESSSLYCDGSIIAHLAGGTGTIQSQWLDSTQNVLASIDSIDGLCSGIYTLHLVDSNSCTNSYTDTIHAGPLPPKPPICLVTVDSTLTHNLLVWEKTNLNMTVVDSFIVYKEVTTNTYQRIGAVSADSLSVFGDPTANPNTSEYKYKLKTKNAHGVLSLLSDYHSTIHLTNVLGNFSWTAYQVENNSTPISGYKIFRDDTSTGNFLQIATTPSTQLTFTDLNFSSFSNPSYYVEAVIAAGACNPTRSSYTSSRSNVKHFSNVGIQQINKNSAITIYPNPAINSLNIAGITEKTMIRLYDVIGKLILEKEVTTNPQLNTTAFETGIYTLITESKTVRTLNKVVISH